MVDEIKDVKPEEAQTPSEPSTEEQEQDTTVSEDVKPQESDLVANARKAMLEERAKRKAEQEKAQELEARIAKMEATQSTSDVEYDEDYNPLAAKVDILTLMQRDEFVKDNLDLIEDQMASNPKLTVQEAVKEIKADYFDRIQKEGSTVEVNKPQSQKPTSTTEPPQETKPKAKDPSKVLQDVLDGKIEIDPEQLESIKRTLGK